MDRTGNDIIVMMLKQMGAVSVKTTPAKITIAKFMLNDDFKLTYVFEARRGEGTYLNRVSPYPMLLGQFFSEQDILDYIERDILRFRHAMESDKFDQFLTVVNEMAAFNREMEQLFLSRPTPEASLDEIDRTLRNLHQSLDQLAEIEPDVPAMHVMEKLEDEE